jgi:hypothetical protein
VTVSDADRSPAERRRAGEQRARAAAARAKVVIDRKRGRETPAWIRELADSAPQAF